ncbi:hypothetical protein RND81_11G090500 [Saponaria officinalis]|uniref:DUF3615 domain-containing protein n=1 Tax=Saponaria officinalis TaxID=3572 RepID=A0AAW1HJQ2_SAPOF
MADYELVEPMAVSYIFAWGCWARMNFKAKRKDADDSSTAIYFAELSVPDEEVTCLAKLDIDLAADNGAYKYCGYCHLDPEEKKEISIGGYGTVYHPVDANWKLGGRPED